MTEPTHPRPHFSDTDADSVVAALRAGAAANRAAACRTHSIDVIRPPGTLIATGDLHDNPLHYGALLRAAGMHDGSDSAPRHLVLHEIIHSDRLFNGMDFSYRVLARVADLKARHPEFVHVLLGNHELAQITGAGIVKDGVRSVDAFNAGVEYVFGGDTDRVNDAIRDFVRSMPLALRCVTPRGDILVSHSLPPAAIMSRFDPSILSRDLRDEDYEPRRGSAHIMVWGRGYDAEVLEDLVERWGINTFIVGHEKVEQGVAFVPPNAVVLNSDHARGVYLPIDLADPPRAESMPARAVSLASMLTIE